MEWPLSTWVRENLVYLAELEFKGTYSWQQDELVGFGRAFHTTLLCENMFNVARKAMRANSRGQLESKTLWHTLAVSNPISKDFDRPCPPITSAAGVASAKKVPSSVFDFTAGECSLSEEQLSSLGSSKPDWPNHGPLNHKLAAMQSQAALKAAGDWKVLEFIWLSLLLEPGTYVHNVEQRKSFIVVAVSRFGFLGFRCLLQKKGDISVLSLADAPHQPVVFEYVTRPEHWKAVALTIVVPGDDGAAVVSNSSCFTVAVCGKPEPLLEFSVQRGLVQMTTFHLKRLFSWLDVPWVRGNKPQTETDLIVAIAKHVLGDKFDETVQTNIIGARTAQPLAAAKMHQPVVAGGLFEELTEELEVDELQHEINLLRQQAVKSQAKAAAREGLLTAAFSQVASRPSMQRDRRQAISWPSEGMSQAAAKKLFPPQCSVSKEATWHHRWKARAPYLGSCSRMFKPELPGDDTAALKYILRQAWKAWLGGDPDRQCPWLLGDGLDLPAATAD
jgi:hypothetical protein